MSGWDEVVVEPRASLNEVMEFCNKVRQAGGGEVLQALLPGVPREPKSCLIAKNLNFDCLVSCGHLKQGQDAVEYAEHDYKWYMFVDSPIRERIAEALDLPIERVHPFKWTGLEPQDAILLPKEIGRVAMAFDKTKYTEGPECIEFQDLTENA